MQDTKPRLNQEPSSAPFAQTCRHRLRVEAVAAEPSARGTGKSACCREAVGNEEPGNSTARAGDQRSRKRIGREHWDEETPPEYDANEHKPAIATRGQQLARSATRDDGGGKVRGGDSPEIGGVQIDASEVSEAARGDGAGVDAQCCGAGSGGHVNEGSVNTAIFVGAGAAATIAETLSVFAHPHLFDH